MLVILEHLSPSPLLKNFQFNRKVHWGYACIYVTFYYDVADVIIFVCHLYIQGGLEPDTTYNVRVYVLADIHTCV